MCPGLCRAEDVISFYWDLMRFTHVFSSFPCTLQKAQELQWTRLGWAGSAPTVSTASLQCHLEINGCEDRNSARLAVSEACRPWERKQRLAVLRDSQRGFQQNIH